MYSLCLQLYTWHGRTVLQQLKIYTTMDYGGKGKLNKIIYTPGIIYVYIMYGMLIKKTLMAHNRS